jgi:hypothetical protein
LIVGSAGDGARRLLGRSPLLAASVGVYSGIGSWIGLPVTAGLDLGDKFGTIGAEAAGLQFIPQDGELNVFRLME